MEFLAEDASHMSGFGRSPVEDEMVSDLDVIRQRLQRNDPEFRHLELLKDGSTYTSLLLEHTPVQEALDACFRECIGNTHVTAVTLTALPETELRFGLEKTQHLQRLQRLVVRQTARSQSLSSDLLQRVLQAHMPIPCLHRTGLTHLDLDIRVAVHTQPQIDALAKALSRSTHLKHINLHILPRCSFADPHLSLHSLVHAMAYDMPKLKSIQLTAGYDHNPYLKPLIHNVTVLQDLVSNNSTLQRLQLDNFGLRDEHLYAIASALTKSALQNGVNNSNHSSSGSKGSSNHRRHGTRLRHLKLSLNHPHQFSRAAVTALGRAVVATGRPIGTAPTHESDTTTTTKKSHKKTSPTSSNSNNSSTSNTSYRGLESCVLWTADECRRIGANESIYDPCSAYATTILPQEHLHMHCLLNQLGYHSAQQQLQQQEQHHPRKDWCRALERAAVAATTTVTTTTAAPESVLSILFHDGHDDEFDDDNDDNNNGVSNGGGGGGGDTTSAEHDNATAAVDRYTLGAIYTLVRSNPAHLGVLMDPPRTTTTLSTVSSSSSSPSTAHTKPTLEDEFRNISTASSQLFVSKPGYSLRQRRSKKRAAPTKPPPSSSSSHRIVSANCLCRPVGSTNNNHNHNTIETMDTMDHHHTRTLPYGSLPVVPRAGWKQHTKSISF